MEDMVIFGLGEVLQNDLSESKIQILRAIYYVIMFYLLWCRLRLVSLVLMAEFPH